MRYQRKARLRALGGRRPYGKSAAKGRWLDDKTFQLESLTVGNDDASIATFTFDDKSLSSRFESLGGFKADLKGETGE